MTNPVAVDADLNSPRNLGELPRGMFIVNNAEGEPLDKQRVNEVTERTLNAAVEFITSQEKVTLVVPLIGGVPLNVELIQKLRGVGYKAEDLNIIYCESEGEGEGKLFHLSTGDDDKPVSIQGTVVVVDDTVDKVYTTLGINKKLQETADENGEQYEGMVVFAPVVKTPALKRINDEKIPAVLIKDGGSLGELNDPAKRPVVAYGEEIQDMWIMGGFGMHGDSIKTVEGVDDKKHAAYVDALERLISECIAGIPRNHESYTDYLYRNSRLANLGGNQLFSILQTLCYYKDQGLKLMDIEFKYARSFFDLIKSGATVIQFKDKNYKEPASEV